MKCVCCVIITEEGLVAALVTETVEALEVGLVAAVLAETRVLVVTVHDVVAVVVAEEYEVI